MLQFRQIHPDFQLEGVTAGEHNSQLIVIRLMGERQDHWQVIPGTRILLIGGEPAKKELRRLVDARGGGISREELQRRGIQSAGSTHHLMRQWLGLT